ncbi:MAG: O-antigen ligase family protein [Solirubrobacterales bacterium]|nr:O-antigen ligase family protein [Solirubrobacterales bacterium]
MSLLAALTGPLPKVGVVLIAVLAAVALLAHGTRLRAAAIVSCLVLSPVLLLAEIWHSPHVSAIRHHPLEAAAVAVAALIFVAALAWLIAPRPWLLGVLAVLTLPFRVPVSAGGSTADLLVPLYFVVAAGALAFALPAILGRPSPLRAGPAPGGSLVTWLKRLLALLIVLYAAQSLYSPTVGSPSGFEKALQNMVFFYVPFAVLFCLLERVEWTPRLLRSCLVLLVAMGLVFSGIAFYEYATRTVLFNSKLVASNQLYTYFVVNSVFFDPNIFGRFVALVMVLLAVLLLYDRPQREQVAIAGVLVVLWVALVLSLSRSSMAGLLVALALVGAVRWRLWRTLAVAAAVLVIGGAAVAISPTTFGFNQSFNGVSAGRGSVLSGGARLFAHRPLLGYGSGSFEIEYHRHNPASGPLTASHTTPVTLAAEQGLVGVVPYVALVVVALIVLVRDTREDPARAAIAAAFAALLVHTMLYADFLEDPTTWALLAVGGALARAPRPREAAAAIRTAPVPAIGGLAAPARLEPVSAPPTGRGFLRRQGKPQQ